MSWSFSAQVTSGDVTMKLEAAAAVAKSHYTGDPEESGWADDQVAAAIKASLSLINGGSVGHSGKLFSVVCGGHSNPSHEPKPGWSNDTITVTVSQVPDGTPA